ncbi:hypothetical protein GPY51_10820 [Photorhabdus laumondii subsp. laumondii]|nr:hypothetical protein [Photorhabdus laumondii]AWK42653.1 hypothetical protein A4R40_14705 [Photorhabdus laumondii subsp. laumondii]AXG47976.1 hypothetical protein PluTT01m_15125 [Photorhabdus laumondii subsp. laumondii]MCC8384633.1 hypothetical protein [Photorhabdus laumondii]MCC8413321.1 hypothetical protein [Photorhabdus laumondii]NDK94986.1 hypothetical protein [Photorhabdus laumondii subsp. laumondii]
MLTYSMKDFKYTLDDWYFDNSPRMTIACLNCGLFFIKISAIKSNNSLINNWFSICITDQDGFNEIEFDITEANIERVQKIIDVAEKCRLLNNELTDLICD